MDLHDLNTRNDKKAANYGGDNELRRKFGSERPYLDEKCRYCGNRYGAHTYDDEVDVYTICPIIVEQEEKDWQDRIKKFWVCWVQGTSVDHFFEHYTLEEAENEAERLAKLPDVQGKEVYIFQCIAKCYTVPPIVAWVVTRKV